MTALSAIFSWIKTGSAFPFSSSDSALTETLIRLLDANAPRAGCALPGAIGELIGALAVENGLEAYFTPNFANTGNAVIIIGASKPQPDVLIAAHMDRPSFRVKDHKTGEIYPVCALRLPEDGYRCAAKALRFDATVGAIVAASRGIFRAEGGKLRYEIGESGELQLLDTIVMDAVPHVEREIITGTGLDNCLGVMSAFGAAVAFAQEQDRLIAANKQIMIAFTDEEEGIPEVFFGHGAARLSTVVRPIAGAIICDAQTVMSETNIEIGQGAAHGVISGGGKGALVAPNFAALAAQLISVGKQFPYGSAQLNTGYLSRSDDMGMSRWTRILGMIGVPMRDPHTAHESASIRDVVLTIEWLTVFTLAVSGVIPEINQAYRL